MTPIRALMYRSVAHGALSVNELQTLLRQCRQRNAQEGLTGFLVVDGDRYIQWLEGPEPGLQRVWTSIQRDRRHRRIELIHAASGTHRLFGDWRMQLGTGATDIALPDSVPLDADLCVLAQADIEAAQALMQAVSLRHCLPPTSELLPLSFAKDEAPWRRLVDRLTREQPSVLALGAGLLKPLTMALGDAWIQDDADSSDLLVAMARMQTMLRSIYRCAPAQRAAAPGVVLVASLPREQHVLGVCVAATAFDLLGWRVQCSFPQQTADLLQSVRQHSCDVLQLALSDSLRAEHRLAELAATVRAVRRASANPQLVVLLSGRAISEQPGLSVVLGADGDGMGQGLTAAALQAQLDFVRVRGQNPAMKVAQATLDELALRLQHSRYGVTQAVVHRGTLR